MQLGVDFDGTVSRYAVTIDLESGDNIEHFKNILYFVLRNSHIGKDNNILYSKLSLEYKED